MREVKLSFWAQSLDNLAPDDMEENNHTLAAADSTKRQALVRRISRVSTSGTRIFLEGTTSVFLLGDEFVLETPSIQLDSAGRIAPIVCYGCIPGEAQELWVSDATDAVVNFAVRVGRGVSEENTSSVRRGLEVVAKKKQSRKLQRTLTYTVVAIVIVFLVSWFL